MSGLVWDWRLHPQRIGNFVGLLFATILAGALVGCSAGLQGVTLTAPTVHLKGSLHGGQQPVAKSAIQIYAMGTTGDASASTPLLPQPVLTDAHGTFEVDTIPCPNAQSQLYIVSIAGNPGLAPGTNNPNLAEMALLGPCASINATTTVAVNEITTVAAIYALAPFMNSYTQIGSDTSDAVALTSAVGAANVLADFSNGTSPGTDVPSGQTVPVQKLHSLANILAACVNSVGGVAGDGSVCGSLFLLTEAAGLQAPGDTIAATLRIAQNPASNVAQIYSLSGWAAPFQPSLAAAPPDWNLFLASPVAAPIFQPAAGSYDLGQAVTLSSSDPTARIYYTTDGSTPSERSTLYSGPIPLTTSTLMRAIAVAVGLSSLNAQASYNIGATQLVFLTSPASTTAGSTFTPSPTVALETASGRIATGLSGPITLSLNSNQAGTTLSGTVTVNAVRGQATFPGLSVSGAALGLTLNASSPGFKSSTSGAFDVQAAANQAAQGSTYFLAPNGDDSNDGTSAASPWLTPNHSLNCGDTIIAASSTQYQPWNFGLGQWGRVSCPSNNNVAWLKCAQFDTCKITVPADLHSFGIAVTASYWGVSGFEVYSPGSLSNGLTCFNAGPNDGVHTIHHVIFANNVANTCPQAGFGMGVSFSGRSSVDYYAAIGNIVYAAGTSNTNCASGISLFTPGESDQVPGTHLYVAGNFVYATVNPANCWDGNGIIFDTFDAHTSPMSPYTQQAVIDNNITISNAGVGVRVEYNNAGSGSVHAPVYVRHNTAWNNSLSPYQNGSSNCGEIQLQQTQNTTVLQNLAVTNQFGCYGSDWFQLAAYQVYSSDGTNVVDNNVGWSNYGFLTQLINTWGFTYGSTIPANPHFANPSTPTVPNCDAYANTTSCMSSLVANFTPTNQSVGSYGYQVPSTVAVKDDLFPKWLCTADLPPGLVTMGCL